MSVPDTVNETCIRDFEASVNNYEVMHGSVPSGSTVLIACSGGPDSMALLHWLVTCKGLGTMANLKLGVACVDHSLRPESKAELAMVKVYAEQYQLPFYELTIDAAQLAKERRQSIETVSRNERYDFFRRLLRTEGYQYIATAHHQDDQGETILAHLLRGAGTNGLRGMQCIEGDLWRPFLGVTKTAILGYVKALGLTFAHDKTNDEPLYLRNRLRLEVIPLMKQYNPNIVATLARLGENMAIDEAYLQQQLELLWPSLCMNLDSRTPAITLQRQAVADLPRSLFFRLWQRVFSIFNSETTFSQKQVNELYEVVQGKKPKQFIRSNVKVAAQYDIIQVGRLNITDKGHPVYRLVGLRCVTWLGPTVAPPPLKADETVLIPQTMAKQGPYLRHRKAGDRIVLRRKDGRIWGHKKLKDWLIDQKIPQADRDALWFLCGDTTVLALGMPKSITIIWDEQATTYWACSIKEEN